MTLELGKWQVVSLLALLISAGTACAEETVLREDVWKDAVSRVLLVPELAFSNIESLGRRVLAEVPQRLALVSIVTDSRNAFDLVSTFDVSYESTARTCERAIASPVRAAVMTKIGPDAVLRIRDGFARRRIILAGRDPLLYRHLGSNFDVLHVSVNQGVLVYAQCFGPLTIESASALYRDLRAKMGTLLRLVIRQDPWFFVDGPAAVCWWTIGQPPKRPTYWQAPEVSCGAGTSGNANEFACSGRRL